MLVINKYLSVLILFLIGCSNGNEIKKNNNNEFDALISASKDQFVGKKYVLLIPNAGCGGCISEAETFVTNYYNASDSLLCIFTNLRSSKQIKLRLGDSIYFHSNIIIDTTNTFYFEEKSVYPIVIELENGNVVNVVEQSPQKPNTISNLQLYFNKNKM